MAKGVVVCYWGPGHKTSGHIGMSVEADAGKTYITWVPTGDSGRPGQALGLQVDFRAMTGIRTEAKIADIALGMGPLRGNQQRTNRLSNTLTKTPTQVQIGSQSYDFNYGQVFANPHLTCEIPAIDHAGGTKLGLDVDRIYHWWVSYAMAAGSMQTVPWKKVSTSRNCCSTVYRALTIGGASYYRSKYWKTFYLTPAEVWKYVTKLKNRIDELNQHTAAVASSAAELGQKLKGLTVGGANVELPTVQEWLAMSKVDLGVLKWKAARKDQIAIIDQSLRDYWQAGPWPSDGDQDEDAVEARDDKAHALCYIIGQAATHAALKPKSDRRHAVAALLTRAWQVMKQRVRGNQDIRQWGDETIKNYIELYSTAFDAYGGGAVADTFAVP